MADTNTTPATTEAATDSAKVKTVIDDMPSRRLFDSIEEANAYIGKCQADFPDFDSYPVAFAGLTEDNDFDPEVYTEDTRVAIAVLTQRGVGPNSSTVKAIVIYPAPKLEAILSTDAGTAWATAIIEKELNHVAVRGLRKAETTDDMQEEIRKMPLTVADFITSNRETSGGILETYNATWQLVKKAIGGKFKAFGLANLSKKELRRGMESASYAAQVYPKLEERHNKAGEPESLFEIAARFGEQLAKKEGLDPAFYTRALESRNERTIEITEDADEDFDFEAELAKVNLKTEDGATGDAAPDANSQDATNGETTDGTGEA